MRCSNDVLFSYGGYGDLASRRKNATRESTATLKAWLNEHKKNPYPTKGEKIMLAAGGPIEPFWDIYTLHKTEEIKEILAEREEE